MPNHEVMCMTIAAPSLRYATIPRGFGKMNGLETGGGNGTAIRSAVLAEDMVRRGAVSSTAEEMTSESP